MKHASHNILVQFLHNQRESLHSLPEHARKIFMVMSMIIVSAFVGLLSWRMFPPLQPVGLPSLGATQQTTNYYQAVDNLKQTVNNNELATVINIPDIGPASGFMESFKAVKNLIVPKNLQDDPPEHVSPSVSWPKSWVTRFSHASQSTVFKLREFAAPILGELHAYISNIPNIPTVDMSHITPHISNGISYASHLPLYLSRLFDLFISSTSRVAI